MILPDKHITYNKCLLRVSGLILQHLDFNNPRTISTIWDKAKNIVGNEFELTYQWFVLSMDLLFIMGIININKGRIIKNVT